MMIDPLIFDEEGSFLIAKREGIGDSANSLAAGALPTIVSSPTYTQAKLIRADVMVENFSRLDMDKF
jgi:hypothetical protein